jgi:Pyruvate/2-oxoacid:ferredoxin oxidoreductase delta subunit
VDLIVELFGVPTDDHLILKFKDVHIAQIMAEHNAGGAIPPEITERRAIVLQDLARWRANSFEKRKKQLGAEAISLKGLTAHLQSCKSCRSTLQHHCPTVDLDFITSQDEAGVESFRNWLNSCSGCGVCDKDCPDDYPLFAVIFSLRGTE